MSLWTIEQDIESDFHYSDYTSQKKNEPGRSSGFITATFGFLARPHSGPWIILPGAHHFHCIWNNFDLEQNTPS